MGNKWFQTQIEMYHENIWSYATKVQPFVSSCNFIQIFFHGRCLDFTYELINGQLANQQKFWWDDNFL
jgi:hypothetical protein